MSIKDLPGIPGTGAKGKQAAIYARVSTTQQVEEGSSLESQVATLSRLASEKGFEVPGEFVFEEDWSGEDLERPQLDQLRTVAREGLISVIFVYSNDRLSRDPLHFLLLVDEWEKQGTQIFFAQELLDTSEEGKLIAYVRGYASKLEAIRFRDRARRGRRARAEKGLLIGGYTLYGYDYIPGKGPEQGRRVVNEREADVIRKMFKWAAEERLTARAISIRLQELGIPAPGGREVWPVGTVHRILRREDYTGSTYAFRTRAVEPKCRRKPPGSRHRKRTVKEARPSEEWVHLSGVTPPIISEELFEAVQHQLRQNAINSPRNRKHSYLLSGRIRCGCGWSMRGRTVSPHYAYYGCRRNGREFGPDRCKARMVRAGVIEDLVWDEIKTALSSPGAILAALQSRQEVLSPERLEGELEAAKGEIDRLKKQERNLIYLYRVGEYDEQLLEVETRRLKEAQAKAILRHEEIREKQLKASELAGRMESFETYCEWASRNLEGLDFDQKRLVLEALAIRVTVDSTRVMIRGFLPVAAPSFSPDSHLSR